MANASQSTEITEAAERYAQAAFELASESGALEAIERDFSLFDAAWAESADLREAAASPLIDPEDKARALVAVSRKLGLSDLGCKLVGAVAANRRARELPAIAKAFRAKLARHRGARQVEIISAAPLSEAEKAAILDQVSKTLKAKIDAETRVDPSLLGGFIVRAGSRQFDSSLKTKLDALKRALKTQ